MQDVVARLEAWLRKNHPAALDGLAPAASAAEIATFEKRLDVRLPDGMRALYRWRNGNKEDSVEAIQHNQHLMSLERVADTREMMAGYVDDGTFEDRDWWHKAWVPFLDNGAGSHLCWDPAGSFADKGGKPGQVVEFWNGDNDRNIVAPSFDAWLTTFVESLEAGMWKYDPDSGNVDEKRGLKKFLATRLSGYPIEAVPMEDEDDDDEQDEEDEEEEDEEEEDEEDEEEEDEDE